MEMSRSKKFYYHRAFDVFVPAPMSRYVDGLKEIDTIFYAKNDKVTEQEVRDSLVNHDGYDFNIVVKENK
jgi:hypothetical protein